MTPTMEEVVRRDRSITSSIDPAILRCVAGLSGMDRVRALELADCAIHAHARAVAEPMAGPALLHRAIAGTAGPLAAALRAIATELVRPQRSPLP